MDLGSSRGAASCHEEGGGERGVGEGGGRGG